jgi:hypothetical protein
MVHAVKRVLAWQVAQEMAALKLSKKSDGKAHENQSQQVDRLLDPKKRQGTARHSATSCRRSRSQASR